MPSAWYRPRASIFWKRMLKLASWIILFYQFFIGILMVKFVDWLVRPFCTNPMAFTLIVPRFVAKVENQ